jgi:uncharacterized membrane protein (DUF106 family)
MPELSEFLEVFETHATVVVILCVAGALIGAVMTRWVDRSSLETARRRVAAYQEEVVLLNDARADLLARVEERGDELRRMKAELVQRVEHEASAPAREEGWR